MSYTYEALSPGGHQEMLEEVFSKVREQVGSYKTASGSLVSFSDGADLPMPSFICNIDAVQDLHGYDAPWVGGAGKNKLSIADKTATTVDNLTITPNKDADGNINGIKLNGSLTRNSYGYEFFEEILPAGSYILNADFGVLTQSGAQILLYSNDYATTYAFVRPLIPSTSFTLSSDTKIRAQLYTYKDNNYSNIIIKPMIRLATETDPTFAPYENICPISGHTGVDAWVRGKNLLPMTVDGIKAANTAGTWSGNTYTYKGIVYTVLTDNNNNITGINADGTSTDIGYFDIDFGGQIPVGNYYANGGVDGGSYDTYDVLFWDGTTGARMTRWDGTTASVSLFDTTTSAEIRVPNITDTLRYRIRIRSGIKVKDITFYPMIRLATETDATYAPYNPNSQTIQVSWQTEAGEVFGGYVDLVSGVLTVTHYKKQLTRNMDWSKSSSGYNAFYVSGAKISPARKEGTAAICNIAKYSSESEYTSKPWYLTRDGSLGMSTDENIIGGTTIDNWKDYISNNTVEICYELATPITYQLTPTQIKSLLGNNNAWCDTGDIKLLQYQPNNIIAELRAEILDLQARVEELEQTE